jgi:hypothetical protein
MPMLYELLLADMGNLVTTFVPRNQKGRLYSLTAHRHKSYRVGTSSLADKYFILNDLRQLTA